MLFHVSFRVEHTRLDRDEFWDEWERETQAALAAIEGGVIRSLYKVAGQRRVIGIVEVELHDQLDQIVMGRHDFHPSVAGSQPQSWSGASSRWGPLAGRRRFESGTAAASIDGG